LHVDFESDDGLVLGQDCGRERGGGHLDFDFNAGGRQSRRDDQLQCRVRRKVPITHYQLVRYPGLQVR